MDRSSVATRALERTLRDTWEGTKDSLPTVFRIFVEGEAMNPTSTHIRG